MVLAERELTTQDLSRQVFNRPAERQFQYYVINNTGGPGSGKDANMDAAAARLRRRYGVVLIKTSTGDMARDAFKDPNNPYHELFIREKEKSEKGGLVSDLPINTVVRDRMLMAAAQTHVLGFTGYPRTSGQLETNEQLCQEILGDSSLLQYAVLVNKLQTAINRADNRNQETEEWNEKHKNQPELQRSKRADDNPDTMRRRYSEHLNGAVPTMVDRIMDLTDLGNKYSRQWLTDVMAAETPFPTDQEGNPINVLTYLNPEASGMNGRVMVHVINAERPLSHVRKSYLAATNWMEFASPYQEPSAN